MRLGLLASLVLVAATPRLVFAVDVPLAGRTIRLTDSPRPEGLRNLVALVDGNVDLSSVDPRVTGATVRIGRDASSVTVLELPAVGWTLTGNAPRIDFKYKSRTGPVRAARLLNGRSIRFTATGEGAYPLGGVVQGEVGVVIDVGGMRFCGAFGGTISRDDGQRFVALRAPAPARCAGSSATTSSTATTTSTSTTTSSPSSSTTTTTVPVLGCKCWAGQTEQQVVTALGGTPTSPPPYCTLNPTLATVAGAVKSLGAASSEFLVATGLGASDACLFATNGTPTAEALVALTPTEFALCMLEVNRIAPLTGWCGSTPPPPSIGVCPTDGTAQACQGFMTASACQACAGGTGNLVCVGAGMESCATIQLNSRCAASVNALTVPGPQGCAAVCGCPLVEGGDACTGVICPGGQTCCGGTCKTLDSDVENCGACGNACATNAACVTGLCIPQLPGCPSEGTAEACSAYRVAGGIAACRSCVLAAAAGTACTLAADPNFPIDLACANVSANALCAYDVNRLGCASFCCPMP